MGVMLGVVFFDNFIILYLFWELIFFFSFLLIFFWREKKVLIYGV